MDILLIVPLVAIVFLVLLLAGRAQVAS